MVAHGCLEVLEGDRSFSTRALVVVDDNDSPLTLRFTLCTLPRSEGVLLPLVHGHLRNLQESGQRGLGCLSRVLLELLLVGTILLLELFVNLVRCVASCSSWHECCLEVSQGRDEELCVLRTKQTDLVLVDRDGLPHRLSQLVPLVVGAGERVNCHERVALL